MSTPIATLLARAAANEHTHSPLPLFSEAERKPDTVIISCIDQRVVPETIFALTPADNVAVCRTVAGHPHTALDGLLAVDVLLGLKHIIILHHTNCGSTFFTEADVKDALKKRCAEHLHADVEGRVYGATAEPIEENLKKDVEWLKSSPLMRKELTENIHGFMWDIKTGKLSPVV